MADQILEAIAASTTVEELATALRDWAEATAIEHPELSASEWLARLMELFDG